MKEYMVWYIQNLEVTDTFVFVNADSEDEARGKFVEEFGPRARITGIEEVTDIG